MISKIGFKNIRVFKDLHSFDIKPLTIFTGPNNSGKSSIQKMLMLLSSGLETKNGRSIVETLEFKKEFIEKVGDFTSNVNYTSDDKEITFRFSFKDKLFGHLDAELVYEGNETGVIANLNKISIYSEDKKILEFFTTNTKAWWKMASESFPDQDLTVELSEISKLKDSANFWHINEELTGDYIDLLYLKLVAQRQYAIHQKNIDEISLKYENDFSVEKLNPKELKTYNYFLEKGIVLGHKKAIDFQEMNKYDEYYFGEMWNIWDSNTKHILKLDKAVKKILDAFPSNVDHPFLIHTELLSVIGDDYTKFIEADDKENKELRKQLISLGLTDFENFSKEYITFEKIFITKEMYNFQVNQKIENSQYEELYHIRYSLDDIINKRNSSISRNYDFYYKDDDFKKNAIADILLKNKLTQVDGGVTIPLSFLKNINRTVTKKTNDRIDKKVNYQHECSNSLYKYFISPLYSFTNELGSFLKNVDIYLNNTAVKRHYIFGQSDSIDSPLLDFGDKFLRGNTKNLKFVNKWLKEFGLADELIINKINTSTANNQSIIGFYFTIKKGEDGVEMPMSDSGLGVHQVLLLLVKLAMIKPGNIILLEEPESNLHPSLQSKLADLFVEAIHSLGVKFLIETHSEYLIRELQYLIASGNLKKEKLSINYLFDPSTLKEGDQQVKVIDVFDDGRLAGQFGSGFFDESSKLMMKTMKASLNK